MSEQPKWRGWVKEGKPIIAIGYLNITDKTVRNKAEETISSIPETHVWSQISITRPEKEYYQKMVGILGKTFTVFPLKIFGKVLLKPPDAEIKFEIKKKP